jgi:transposase
MGKHRRYTDDFKREAVSLADRLDHDAKAARQLGINPSLIFQWRKQMGLSKSDLDVSQTDPKAEMIRLQKENAELKKVNEILKRAAAFFSQDHLK